MKKSILIASVFTFASVASLQAQQKPASDSSKINKANIQETNKAVIKAKVVGGAQMLPSKNIVENASHSKDHTTLVKAIQAAGLSDSLKAAGPFTVFAPTNDAFAKLPAGALDTLVKPANKEKLADVVTYHVVKGKMTSRDLALAVSKANGNATLTTVDGDVLNVSINAEKNLQITDAQGNIALVTIFDVEQSNGIVHVINNVLLPKDN